MTCNMLTIDSQRQAIQPMAGNFGNEQLTNTGYFAKGRQSVNDSCQRQALWLKLPAFGRKFSLTLKVPMKSKNPDLYLWLFTRTLIFGMN